MSSVQGRDAKPNVSLQRSPAFGTAKASTQFESMRTRRKGSVQATAGQLSAVWFILCKWFVDVLIVNFVIL